MAFACAFTMFAGAAFTDQADIKVDADVVDTLVSLGIIEGFEDGSFQPNATVTRAQMAKMIYVLRTGKSDASAYNDDKTSFTDIGSHWARGYIKYCQSLGIIAGKSNTIFAPNATVTAQEAAKMLLVTLGYDANKAGLVGAGWAAKTNALADENGLLEDVNTSFTGPCPRQYAAQLIYNAIDTATVVWRDDAYTNQNYNGDDNKTIGEKYMGLHSVEGILTSFAKEDGKDTYGATVTSITKQDGSKNVKLNPAEESFTKISKDYGSLKNNKVKVLYKDTDEVYGVFALTDSNKVVNGLLGDFGDDGDKLKLDGTKYTVGTATTAASIGSDAAKQATADKTNLVKVDGSAVATNRNDLVKYVKSNVSGLAKAFDASAISNTDNNKINLLDIKTFAIAQVTYVGSDYINVSYKNSSNTQNFSSKLKDDDAVWYNGIAKDDYVAVTKAVNTSADKIGVTKLDVVTGKITGTKNAITAADYKVTVNGTTYEMAGVTNSDAADLTLNATVSIVVKGGYCLLVDDADAGSKDLALMTELYQEGNKWKATLLKADGSEETVTLKKSEAINGNDVATAGYGKFDGSTTADAAKIKIVTYTKSGDEYKLKVVGDTINGSAYKAGYDVVTPVVASNNVKNNKLTKGSVSAINENAVVFVRYKTDSFKVVTGKDLRDWKEASVFSSVVLADKSNGVPYAKVVYADLGSDNVKGGTDVNYGYVFEATKSTDADETDYNVFQIWNGSETIEVWTEDGDDVARGDVIKYSLDGTVENHTKISVDKVFAKADGTTGVVLNGDYSDKLDGTAYFAPANGAAKVNKTTAETAAAQAANILTFDDDDDSIILFANTSDDDKDGTGVASASVTNLKDYVREDGTDYVTNAIYWIEKDAQNQPTKTKIMVIDTDSELDTGVFNLN
nr:S-layer homology domain-containing protein [Butyricicoccus faecihominis]